MVDGDLDDWRSADWVAVDKRGVAAYFNSGSKPYDIRAAVAVAGERLYAAFRTGEPDLLRNSGELPLAPFKTGGALDLMIGADAKADDKRSNPVEGDVRLLVTTIHGKPFALVYRAVVPGVKTPVPFSSPCARSPLTGLTTSATRCSWPARTATTSFLRRWPRWACGRKPV